MSLLPSATAASIPSARLVSRRSPGLSATGRGAGPDAVGPGGAGVISVRSNGPFGPRMSSLLAAAGGAGVSRTVPVQVLPAQAPSVKPSR